VKVMVGGAPLYQSFADSIGADGYAKDAAEAVSLARKMIAV
jgi:methanogenic corrinoid protein MtbC1